MERKHFLTAAMGAAAVLAATGLAANAAPPQGPISTPMPPQPVPGSTPTPTRTHNPNWQRGQGRSNHNISKVRHHLEHVIDELQHDQYDYGGHRETALDLLQRARTELLAAEQYESQHPGGQPTARPF